MTAQVDRSIESLVELFEKTKLDKGEYGLRFDVHEYDMSNAVSISGTLPPFRHALRTIRLLKEGEDDYSVEEFLEILNTLRKHLAIRFEDLANTFREPITLKGGDTHEEEGSS